MTTTNTKLLPGVVAVLLGVGVLAFAAFQLLRSSGEDEDPSAGEVTADTTVTIITTDTASTAEPSETDGESSTPPSDTTEIEVDVADEEPVSEPETVVLSTNVAGRTELARTGAGDRLLVLTALALSMCGLGMAALEKQRRMTM